MTVPDAIEIFEELLALAREEMGDQLPNYIDEFGDEAVQTLKDDWTYRF